MSDLMKRPLSVRIAADARSGRVNPQDDHIWELSFAQRGDEPAISLQTRYGGRVGLARLVPVIQADRRTLYEKSTLAYPYELKEFAPDAVRVEGEPKDGLQVSLFAWVINSHTLGGWVNVTNKTGKAVSVEIGLHLQAITEKAMHPAKQLVVKLPQGIQAPALSLSQLGNLNPVLLMEDAEATETAKLVTPFEMAPDEKQVVRFVLASLPSMDDSLDEAYEWLSEPNWRGHQKTINERLRKLPIINTGDDRLDAAIAWSQQAILRSLVSGGRLPYPSPVFVRTPSLDMEHSNQPDLDTYLLTSSLAVIDPQLAKGVIANYFAIQQIDGRIDGRLSVMGETGGYLILPVLAQMTEIVYAYTRDDEFLKNIFLPLLKYYARWFEQDRDKDGFPEWLSLEQANFGFHPSFSLNASSTTSADVRNIESPDLAAYLLREGESLMRIANIIGRKGESEWKKIAEPRYEMLLEVLQKAWQEDRFYYLDRDSDQTLVGETIFSGNGESSLPAPVELTAPNRLIIQAEGGTSHHPLLRVAVTGLDINGKLKEEIIEDFSWYRGNGTASSQTIWNRLDHVRVEGLSRVYKYTLRTPDLSRHDISLFLPYLSHTMTPEQVNALTETIRQETTYWRPHGLPVLPASDPQYQRNGKQVVLPWMMMLGLALIEHGETRLSSELFSNITDAQLKTLVEQGGFYQWYNAEDGTGMGMPDHISGAIMLHWLMQLVGVRVLSPRVVEVTGEFALKRGVKIKWHGVRIARTNRSLKIKFPSGREVELPATAKPQLIYDKNK